MNHDDDVVADAVMEWEDAADGGHETDPAEFCRHRPDLLARVRALLRRARRA